MPMAIDMFAKIGAFNLQLVTVWLRSKLIVFKDPTLHELYSCERLVEMKRTLTFVVL